MLAARCDARSRCTMVSIVREKGPTSRWQGATQELPFPQLSGGFTSNVWPTVGYALLTAGVLSLYVAPVVLVLGAVCGAAWDWVAR